jgi:leucyl-tRNA synthetase
MPEKPYDHRAIELKWHALWQDADFYQAEENTTKPKFYVLEMLPYPSGTLHIATFATTPSATRSRVTSG